MNTMAQTCGSLREHPKEGKARELRVKQDLDHFKKLKNPIIRSTKWVCPAVVNHLGIGDDFNILLIMLGGKSFCIRTPNLSLVDIGAIVNTDAHHAHVFWRRRRI
jgi:hypothetical protein